MRLTIALLSLLAAGPALAWGDCEFTAERRAELDASALRELVVQAGAGELDIRGEAGRTQIEAIGKACADSAEQLEQVQLLARTEGNRGYLETRIPDSSGWSSGYASLSLTVRVPANLALDVSDSSGDSRVEAVAALEIRDSSGDLRLDGIRGPVGVEDSSGDIEIAASRGPVSIRSDSSGDIRITDIEVSVEILRDSSGGIVVGDVRGDAIVRSDSSGDIELRDIDGNAEVGSDSSGSISVARIGGGFRVGSDGSGSIDYRDVAGPVAVPED